MLTVETRLAMSKIHGLGLLATQPIKKGVIVSYFGLDFDRLSSCNADLPKITQEFLEKYAFNTTDGVWLFNDNARFINHAKNANLAYSFHLNVGFSAFHCFVALNDIPSGAELTIDYETFDKEHYKRICDFEELHDARSWPPKVPI